MKISSYIVLLIVLIPGCAEEKSPEFPFNPDGYEAFIRRCQYESYFASKDSSCIEVITFEQIKSGKEITINLGNHCDSIEIGIPPGGTTTMAGLYTDSTRSKAITPEISFNIEEFITNHFTVSSKLRGRYLLDFGSCHFWNQIWVNFK